MEFLQFIMLVIIVEATWESTKMVWEDDINLDFKEGSKKE